MNFSRLATQLSNALLCLAASTILLSCATRREAPFEAVPGASPADQAASEQRERQAVPVMPPQPEPRILTLADYKLAVARRIAQSNPQHLYEGPPPPMLKSVVVLTISVDAEGHPVRLRVMRGNGHRALEQLAVQSVQQAAPLPRPGDVARRGLAEFNETWLFREDGRFQLRSTAEAQADS